MEIKTITKEFLLLLFTAECGVPKCQRTRAGAKIMGDAGNDNIKMRWRAKINLSIIVG